MLEWSRLSDDQLADYVDLNLTLDQQVERVIEIVEYVIFTDDINEFSYDLESIDNNSLIYFISINMTLLDQAKDIYTNNLGSMSITDDIEALIDETIDKFSLTNMINDVVFMIAKHLKYDEIVNMCSMSSQFVKLCKSKIFWIMYLKDVHDIIGVSNLDIDLLKEGVKFIETNRIHRFHWIDEDLHIFVKRLFDPENDFNPDNFINLHELKLMNNNQMLDLSKLVNLRILDLGYNNQELNLSKLVNLYELNLAHNNQELDLSELVNLNILDL